jgi:phosphatidyl-myo-inositol dimannoside synthase
VPQMPQRSGGDTQASESDARSPGPRQDIVLSQDFFPKIGGAHLWIYETYRRWPTPVVILTGRFGTTPAQIAAEAAFDRRDHGTAHILRRDIAIDDINLLDSRCRKRIAHVAALLRELASVGPATIHCLRAFPEGLCALWSKRLLGRAIRMVVYAHGEEILVARSSRQLRLIARLVYRCADLVIANSRSTEALVKGLCPRAEVVCIHPGVDADAFVRSDDDLARFRSAWQWPAGTVIVGTIARMEPRKNQAAVIRAIASLRREGLPLAYVCGGDGAERQSLEALVEELGMQPWVRFTGALSDDEKIMTYGACDFYAMPSIRVGEMIEGFGIVFMEAGAAGIASICGNIGGQPEAVLDGKTGLVIDGCDPLQVQDAIRRLAQNVPLRKEMGRGAAVWARSHDWSRVSAAVSSAVRGRLGLGKVPRWQGSPPSS